MKINDLDWIGADVVADACRPAGPTVGSGWMGMAEKRY